MLATVMNLQRGNHRNHWLTYRSEANRCQIILSFLLWAELLLLAPLPALQPLGRQPRWFRQPRYLLKRRKRHLHLAVELQAAKAGGRERRMWTAFKATRLCRYLPPLKFATSSLFR